MSREAKKAEAERLLSVSEVAALLGVTRPAVLTAIREGRLPAERSGGVGVSWVWAIRASDAAAWRPRSYRRTAIGRTGTHPRVKRLAPEP